MLSFIYCCIIDLPTNRTQTIDPYNPHADILLRLEDIDDSQLATLISFDEIVYAAEPGNRDEYASNPNIALSNARRFTGFIERIVKLSANISNVHVTYAGGSWTRRKALPGLEVSDLAPAKTEEDGANPYELAKTEAAKLAEYLSTKHSIDISFWDWISVVPNFAPNFTISKMTKAAVESKIVTFSPGPYGRPLLHAQDAGRAVVMLAEDRLKNRSLNHHFELILLPGHFTTFETFADAVVEIVKIEKGIEIAKISQMETPDWLKTTCLGSSRLRKVNFSPDETLIMEGLKETCTKALSTL